MSSKPHREEKKSSKNVRITSKCFALILKEVSDSSLNETSSSTSSQTSASAGGSTSITISDLGSEEKTKRKESGIGIFEDFQHKNSSCYWNPQLGEVVGSLRYIGILQPHVLLVGGKDVDLEGLSVAWSRRLLKPPQGFALVGLGEIPGIEMQTISQTHFTPLPEALCAAVADLNANKELADMSNILGKLQDTYSGVELPSNGIIYDTLGVLIKEKKLLHTGTGYFVVTPDMYDVPLNITVQEPMAHIGTGVTENELAKLSPLLCSMSPMQTMILPIVTTPSKVQVKTKSCQTNFEKEVRHLRKLERSQSMREKQSRLNTAADKENFSRTLSLRYKEDKAQTLFKEMNENVNLLNNEKDKEKQADKPSFLTKLWNKCKQKKPESSKEVEHATFSAQFPPPEWQWYQQHKNGSNNREHHNQDNHKARQHYMENHRKEHNDSYKTEHQYVGKHPREQYDMRNKTWHHGIKSQVTENSKNVHQSSLIPKAHTWHHFQSAIKDLDQHHHKGQPPNSRPQCDRSMSLDHRNLRNNENGLPTKQEALNENPSNLEGNQRHVTRSKHQRRHKKCSKTSRMLNKSRESLVRKRQTLSKSKHRNHREKSYDHKASPHMRKEELGRYSSTDEENPDTSNAYKFRNPHLMYQQSWGMGLKQSETESESGSDLEKCSTVKECPTRAVPPSVKYRGENSGPHMQNYDRNLADLPGRFPVRYTPRALTGDTLEEEDQVMWSSDEEVDQVGQYVTESAPQFHNHEMKAKYLGYLPHKRTGHTTSKDNGVNCIGLQVIPPSEADKDQQLRKSITNSQHQSNRKNEESKDCHIRQELVNLQLGRENAHGDHRTSQKFMGNGNLRNRNHDVDMALRNHKNTGHFNCSPNSTQGDSGFSSPMSHSSPQSKKESSNAAQLQNGVQRKIVTCSKTQGQQQWSVCSGKNEGKVSPSVGIFKDSSLRHHGNLARHHGNKGNLNDNGNEVQDSRSKHHKRIVEGSETNCHRRVQFQNGFAVKGT
ncbi:uncharacterized protein LOC106162715 isoform X1 [Lingula anatina]|uniref:Uncharacterized protein LOC106162715 isoform X1 n=1 Tax=Lingula anatina TaxID=7574 RepID=A0A1S3IBL3_LINAN|nr:uncharacterized protein LOC106162715 isoform X1 [Lingula anatina]|eukprot:XP_013395558.1 uncharacterized protein LOC106162715 isoform X1 [Lingula anatina]